MKPLQFLLIFVHLALPKDILGLGCKQLINLFSVSMIDRALGLGPVQQQSYYFQLIPLYLSIVGKQSELPSQGTTYRFNVWKGQQKFDQNKFPIQANFKVANGVPVMSVSSCKLNFYLPNFNRLRKQQFTLRLIQNQKDQDFDIGEYTIDVGQMVEAFKKENKFRHELKTFFSEDYQLDFEVYIERTRVALQRAIKENRNERVAKSPLRPRNNTAENTPSKPTQSQLPERDQTTSKAAEEAKPKAKESAKEEAKEEPKADQANPLPKIQDIVPTIRRESTAKVDQQQSLKNQSVSSGHKVPIIQTKFKQLAKQDTPTEVKMLQSQRLSTSHVQDQASSKSGDSSKQKLLMWIFLVFGVVVMYFAMHPIRRV